MSAKLQEKYDHALDTFIAVFKDMQKENTELKTRVEKLEAVLQKVLDDTEIGVVPRSHLDKIEELLK